jgi:hypothetical protein
MLISIKSITQTTQKRKDRRYDIKIGSQLIANFEITIGLVQKHTSFESRGKYCLRNIKLHSTIKIYYNSIRTI